MISIFASKALAIVTDNETLTSGMAGAEIKFSFSEDWDNLTKTAIFRAGDVANAVIGSQWTDNVCTIPHETLATAGEELRVGVYGVNSDKKVIIPTIWATVGVVRVGVDPSADESTDATLPVWAQVVDSAEKAAKGAVEDVRSEVETSATAAANSATAAANSATAAAGAASDAKDWASTAADAATDAATQSSAAADSAKAAASSASSASASATMSASSATEAGDWSTTASSAATDAATQSSAAADSAKAAASSATSASSSATAASGASSAAADSATLAKSWAVGGTGTRDGEDTNNAKYWAENSENAVFAFETTIDPEGTWIASATYDEVLAAVNANKIILVNSETAVEARTDSSTVKLLTVSRKSNDDSTLNSPILRQITFSSTSSTITVEETTISSGSYSPPTGGIPKSDLASDVQTSLNKADTALQSYTETDPTVPAWAKADTKPTYTAEEVGALPITGGTLAGNLSIVSGHTLSVADAVQFDAYNSTTSASLSLGGHYENGAGYLQEVELRNLATPTTGLSAANKAYVDAQVSSAVTSGVVKYEATRYFTSQGMSLSWSDFGSDVSYTTFTDIFYNHTPYDITVEDAEEGTITRLVFDCQDGSDLYGHFFVDNEMRYFKADSTGISEISVSRYRLISDSYSKSETDTLLASAGKVKTVNGVEPDANGNITISTAGGTQITDDGSGNITITCMAADVTATDDGSGNITLGGA